MTAIATTFRRGGSSVGRRVGRFWSAISAVSIKELRGRMRGRRAFVVLTIYLLLLGAFSFAIYFYLKQQAAQIALTNISDPGIPRDFPGFPGFPGGIPGQQTLANGTALSAGIGHGIFGGLLFLETLLVLVLAPAFTTGAISLEREKQTLDMLVTTPLSTLGMIIGKLFSALTYVFLLIVASIPLASLVFVFGGVGPEDLVRAYAFLFALAFGMGAIGLFISAIVRRTQTATVVTFVLVLLLSIGTAAAHQFWQVAPRSSTANTSVLSASSRGKAPEALLWLNPFVADLDMVCATAPDSYHQSCDYISSVTRKPYFGTPPQTNPGIVVPFDVDFQLQAPAPVAIDRLKNFVDGVAAPECPPNAACAGGNVVAQQQVSLGFPHDTFWPKSAAAFVVLGIALTLASAQLVSPTRRIRLPRFGRPTLRRREIGNQPEGTASDTAPATGAAEGPVLAKTDTDQKVEMAE